ITFDAGAAIHTLTPVGNGNDIVNVLGGTGNDHLTGTAGSDMLDGNNSDTPNVADNDVLNGLGGNDVLLGGAGNDTIDGGGGIDTARYSGPITINTNGSGGWTVVDAGGTDTLSNLEIVDDGAGGRTLLVGNGGFGTIQAAVNAAHDGD